MEVEAEAVTPEGVQNVVAIILKAASLGTWDAKPN
jgi:hypothetical protein